MTALHKIKAGHYENDTASIRYVYCGRCGAAFARWLVEFKDGRKSRWARTLSDARVLAA